MGVGINNPSSAYVRFELGLVYILESGMDLAEDKENGVAFRPFLYKFNYQFGFL